MTGLLRAARTDEYEGLLQQGVAVLVDIEQRKPIYSKVQDLVFSEARDRASSGWLVGHYTVFEPTPRHRRLDRDYCRVLVHLDTFIGALAKDGPTPEQLGVMQRLVAESMEQGAFGLSVGLTLVPSSFAVTDELVALGSVPTTLGSMFSTRGCGPAGTPGRSMRRSRSATSFSPGIQHVFVAGQAVVANAERTGAPFP